MASTRTRIGLLSRTIAACLQPPPDLSVWQWADRHRILSGKAASEPGPWRTDRTPYLREIMESLSPRSPWERVVFIKGTQLGGTECGNNLVGYVIHHAPGPMLMVQPTVELAKRVSKQRIAPMIEETPALRHRIAPARSRDSGNTMFVKEFTGGCLILTGANSGVGLRSMPVRVLFLDEIDGYPQDVDGEGDPVSLAEKRTANFANRKIFLVSTPTVKGQSPIEAEYLASDQRRYFLPCPHCGNMDWIRWTNMVWEHARPDTARLKCEACGALIDEHYKGKMLATGEWRPTAAGNGLTVGYHLSSLYSPLGWRSWESCVREFLSAKSNPLRLKTWTNTVLGDTWQEEGDSVDAGELEARLEPYQADVPAGVGVLTAGVDVHPDRLECGVWGWGAGEESWLIGHYPYYGDPEKHGVWDQLEELLSEKFQHPSGPVQIEAVCIDSGHLPDAVYKFCKTRRGRRVWPVKGMPDSAGRELVGRPTRNNSYRVQLFPVNTVTAKDVIFARMAVKAPGPGYVHLPADTDPETLAQLTAERRLNRYRKGRRFSEYVKTRERNEALDCLVYALAALYTFGPVYVRNLAARVQALAARHPDPEAPKPAAPALSKKPAWAGPVRSGGWVNGWK